MKDMPKDFILLVCLYVDDALIAYSSKSALQAMRRALAGAHSAFLTFIGLHIPLRTTRDFLTEDRMPFPHILCKRHHVTWILIFSVAFCFLYSFPSSSVLKLLTLMFRNSTYTYQSLSANVTTRLSAMRMGPHKVEKRSVCAQATSHLRAHDPHHQEYADFLTKARTIRQLVYLG